MTERPKDRKTERQKDRKTERQNERQNRHKDTKKERQTERQTYFSIFYMKQRKPFDAKIKKSVSNLFNFLFCHHCSCLPFPPQKNDHLHVRAKKLKNNNGILCLKT